MLTELVRILKFYIELAEKKDGTYQSEEAFKLLGEFIGLFEKTERILNDNPILNALEGSNLSDLGVKKGKPGRPKGWRKKK